jgi:hypothetical protein
MAIMTVYKNLTTVSTIWITGSGRVGLVSPAAAARSSLGHPRRSQATTWHNHCEPITVHAETRMFGEATLGYGSGQNDGSNRMQTAWRRLLEFTETCQNP